MPPSSAAPRLSARTARRSAISSTSRMRSQRTWPSATCSTTAAARARRSTPAAASRDPCSRSSSCVPPGRHGRRAGRARDRHARGRDRPSVARLGHAARELGLGAPGRPRRGAGAHNRLVSRASPAGTAARKCPQSPAAPADHRPCPRPSRSSCRFPAARAQALRCAASRGSRRLDDPAHEIIIVDDASTDLEPLLARLEGDVQVVRNDRRLGFGLAAQRGAERARGSACHRLRWHRSRCLAATCAAIHQSRHHAHAGAGGSRLATSVRTTIVDAVASFAASSRPSATDHRQATGRTSHISAAPRSRASRRTTTTGSTSATPTAPPTAPATRSGSIRSPPLTPPPAGSRVRTRSPATGRRAPASSRSSAPRVSPRRADRRAPAVWLGIERLSQPGLAVPASRRLAQRVLARRRRISARPRAGSPPPFP